MNVEPGNVIDQQRAAAAMRTKLDAARLLLNRALAGMVPHRAGLLEIGQRGLHGRADRELACLAAGVLSDVLEHAEAEKELEAIEARIAEKSDSEGRV